MALSNFELHLGSTALIRAPTQSRIRFPTEHAAAESLDVTAAVQVCSCSAHSEGAVGAREGYYAFAVTP